MQNALAIVEANTQISFPQQATHAPPQQARNKLRFAVSLDVLFRSTAANTLSAGNRNRPFASHHAPLKPGPGFPLIKRIAQILNTPNYQAAEISILAGSRQNLHRRICESLEAHGIARRDASLKEQGINILHGTETYKTLLQEDAGYDLFLTTDQEEAIKALHHGIPAGYVDPHVPVTSPDRKNLVFAFDWDRCVAINTSTPAHPCFGLDTEEYTRINGIPAATQRESALTDVPGHPGPWGRFYWKSCALRNELRARGEDKLVVAIVTARTEGSFIRAKKTDIFWGTHANIFKSAQNGPKHPILNVIKPDLFGDDSPRHFNDCRELCPNTLAVHIPWAPKQMERVMATYQHVAI